MGDFHFLRPEWLLLIPAWLALVAWWRRRGRGGSPWHRYCDARLAAYVVEGGGAWPRRLAAIAAAAGVVAALALAGPAWRELPQPVFRGQAALVVVLDVSRSMNAGDIEPSRLTRARHKVRDLLARRRDGQTALVAYAGDAFAVTPLTDDTATIAALLSSLDPGIMPVQGSRTDRALDQARALLERAGVPRGRVLLISDGVGGPGVDRALEALAGSGYTLSVIGIGRPEGAPIPAGDGFVRDDQGGIVVTRLDESALSALARRGGGAYARYTLGEEDLEQALPADALETGVRRSDLAADRWREEGPWLLLALMALVLPGFRRGMLD